MRRASERVCAREALFAGGAIPRQLRIRIVHDLAAQSPTTA